MSGAFHGVMIAVTPAGSWRTRCVACSVSIERFCRSSARSAKYVKLSMARGTTPWRMRDSSTPASLDSRVQNALLAHRSRRRTGRGSACAPLPRAPPRPEMPPGPRLPPRPRARRGRPRSGRAAAGRSANGARSSPPIRPGDRRCSDAARPQHRDAEHIVRHGAPAPPAADAAIRRRRAVVSLRVTAVTPVSTRCRARWAARRPSLA